MLTTQEIEAAKVLPENIKASEHCRIGCALQFGRSLDADEVRQVHDYLVSQPVEDWNHSIAETPISYRFGEMRFSGQ